MYRWFGRIGAYMHPRHINRARCDIVSSVQKANYYSSKNSKMPSFDKSFHMNHTCLRIKDPKVSVPFYQKYFGMELLRTFPMDGFSLYMLGYPTDKKVNWADREGILELCHNHGVENKEDYVLNNGNGEKFRGFGHICVLVDNIAECEKKLLADGVKFRKKLSDGRQKNIAFALDPDGYWIELVEHAEGKQEGITSAASYKFHHTMIRIKDPAKSLTFYQKVLGMKLIHKLEHEGAKFTLYFLGYDHNGSSAKGEDFIHQEGLIELTHNWGTELDESFEGYHNGNSTENGATQGYGHTCVSCDDPAKFCEEIDTEFGNKVFWSIKWNEGKMKNLAFIKDPDGYLIEIIPNDIFAE